MKRVEGSFKILIRNLRLRKNEKNKIQENEDTLLQREESKDF
jgi:hypothetical protein